MKILLAMIAILFTMGCSKNLRDLPEASPNPLHTINRLATDGYEITIFEIDGCQYIVKGAGGIIHKANCPNPEHKEQK